MAFDFDWGSVAKNFVTQIPNVYSAYQANRNVQAGNAAAGRVAAAGTADQVARLDAIRRAGEVDAAPAIAHYKSVMAAPPQVLTPQQDITLKDAQRDFGRGNALGRMGGRAFTRGFSDMTNRFRAGAVQSNERRQDAAAAPLMARGAQGIAAGTAGANAVNAGADTQANLVAATGQNQADTMAAIGSYFANAIKDSDRESRYKDYKSGGA